MILHIPHSSDSIPDKLKDQIVLSDEALDAELLLMTDAFNDQLFAFPKSTVVRFPFSRLLVDVERFPDDATEPMSKVGMGMIYTHTAYGKPLRRKLLQHERRNLISQYELHHQMLLDVTTSELEKYGQALIIDCHSFPSQPLPCDANQSIPRPQICVGTDSFHTPEALILTVTHFLKEKGYDVRINQPYAGSMVPLKFYGKEDRVISIMIEVNRELYMDEVTGDNRSNFNSIREHIQSLLQSMMSFRKEDSAGV